MMRVLFNKLNSLRVDFEKNFFKEGINKFEYDRLIKKIDKNIEELKEKNIELVIEKEPCKDELTPQIRGFVQIDTQKFYFRCVYVGFVWKIISFSDKKLLEQFMEIILLSCYLIRDDRKKLQRFEFLKNIFGTR